MRRLRPLLLLTALAAACSHGTGASFDGGPDGAGSGARADADTGGGGPDGSGLPGAIDASGPGPGDPDASGPGPGDPDASGPGPGSPDAGGDLALHVHIYIDNFCNVSTDPTEVSVPPGGTVVLSYHNHSVDYEADVWLSYIGGFLDLPEGATWDDSFDWCATPLPYEGWADINIAGGPTEGCPGVRFAIHCL